MLKKNIFRILVLIALVVVAFVAFEKRELFHSITNPREVKHYIRSFRVLGPVIFVLIYTLRTFLVAFPVAMFVIIGGSLFGGLFGFLLSMIGAFLSASLAFFTGRYVAKDAVNKYLSGKVKALHGIDKKGFKLVLYLRLIMIMPFDIFSYAVGATKITYKDFILGTMLGIAPEFLGYSYIGSIGSRGHIPLRYKILFSAGILTFIIIMHFVKVAYEKRKKTEE